jgi:hypothetical protein
MADSLHISDHDLERYAMGAVKDAGELAALEEHLLACGWCIDRAENTEGYIGTMRAALGRLQARRDGA